MKIITPISFGLLVSVCLMACSPDHNEPDQPNPATNDKKSTSSVSSDLPIISSTLPPVPPFSGTVSLPALQHDFDVFSWESFIALNWPANEDGSPNTGVNIGDAPGTKRVWQNYKESRDIFLPGGAVPPAWDQINPPPSICNADDGKPVLHQVGKTPNVLDESGEPFKTGPLIDQNGQYTRFEILTNEVMFNYIRNNKLYSKAGQTAFANEADFPFSTKKVVGSIMIKASWKIMGENDVAENFYTSKAYVYDNPDENAGVTEKCVLQTVGLVGLHIGTKAKGNPQWLWSTFEHIDNVPTQGEPITKAHYNYFKPKCKDCTEVNTPPARPWIPGIPFTQPGQIMRVIAIDAATKKLNASYHAALEKLVKGSVWRNYELVSTQWPTDASSKTDPTGVPAPTFLANTTLETYIQGEIRQTSSSCIQCHNNATMTTGKFSDFTYLLQRAQ